MKRIAVVAIVGGLVMWVVGYVIFDVLVADFYAANAGSATGVARDVSIRWADMLGTLSLALLVTLAVNWAGGSSIGEGFKVGATVGFLAWFGVDFIYYGFSNVWNLTVTIVDPLLEIVRTGIGGAVIAMMFARCDRSSAGEAAPAAPAGTPPPASFD